MTKRQRKIVDAAKRSGLLAEEPTVANMQRLTAAVRAEVPNSSEGEIGLALLHAENMT